ncbi:aminotransferase class I/II-fold pyridoxal phosphate-dependent enzyme [Nitratireductor sp. XY-223]|uniref:serine hydroxymethyltransferase n=1 Tax=Nitratireductor sp. XY-223 TaxID=2561926 RepID=UPI0010A9C2A4|nr:aminotransferase class I/II-fold pyridoxal phosphate-dependent enzyme [Nitratireductor sp. XY-223]
MTALKNRNWVPDHCEKMVQAFAGQTANSDAAALADRLSALIDKNRDIHERECFNLNPATNVMNPRAESVLAAGLGSRPSLGYPGEKYEMGLEAIEEIEVIAAELCAEVFKASYAEIRVASGAMANLYAFISTCRPGDAIIAPPAKIGGHVTHHNAGCAGLYGLEIHEAPVNPDGYTIDIEGLAELAGRVRPKLITVGGSLNLFPHPVRQIREIADTCNALVLFDAAHQCGIIAGGAWPAPLEEGAHLMTMSTYKSLGGPAGGLIVTNSADLAEKLDAIAFPGMTANFDAAKSAALALTMLDWREFGAAYSEAMIALARRLAEALDARDVPLFGKERGFTDSHQFAVEAGRYGGGQTAAKKLRNAGFLACGIGLPIAPVPNDVNGLRIGTPELTRWGVGLDDVEALADLIAGALEADAPETLAAEVRALRARFNRLHFIHTGR